MIGGIAAIGAALVGRRRLRADNEVRKTARLVACDLEGLLRQLRKMPERNRVAPLTAGQLPHLIVYLLTLLAILGPGLTARTRQPISWKVTRVVVAFAAGLPAIVAGVSLLRGSGSARDAHEGRPGRPREYRCETLSLRRTSWCFSLRREPCPIPHSES